MAALDRVLQRVEALNFDNRVVSLIQNLKRYGVADKPIETDDGSVVEVMMAICAELDLMDLRIMRIEEALAPKAKPATVTEPVEPPAQTTIDGGEEPHDEVAEKANPKKPAAKKKA